jgi:hypothetical protein
MSYTKRRDAGWVSDNALFRVFLLILQSFVLHVAILWFGLRFVIVFVVILVIVILVVVLGDNVQTHRVELYHFQLGFTFRAIQNLALFHFILVDIDLDGAFRAAHHSRTSWPSMALDPSKRII